MKNYYFGIVSEYITAFLYIIKFYKILELRYRNYAGEIDLICTRRNTIAFVEVKARSNNSDDILLRPNQSKRIKNAAIIFLQKNPVFNNFNVRFDLVIIRPFRFPEIIENAW